MEGKTEGLVSGALGRDNGIQGIDQGVASGRVVLDGLGPAFLFLAIAISSRPPRHLLRLLQHVVSMPARDGAEDDFFGVVSNLLDVTLDFLTNLQETGLAVWSRSGAVHLVDTNDELLDTQSEGKESMLASLAILGNTSFELT